MFCLAAKILNGFPRVEGAVGGGCLVALASICLIQYLWNVRNMRRNRQRVREYEDQIAGLCSELDDIQEGCQLARYENRILRGFISLNDIGKATELLLKYFAPNPVRGFACLLGVENSQLLVEQSRGLSPTSNERLSLKLADFAPLKQHEMVHLQERELRQCELWLQLSAEDRRKAQEVFLLPLGKDNEICGVVLTTSLYPATALRDQQLLLARRLMASIGGAIRQSQTLRQREQQLRFTGEMLQLRSLTDRNFATPLEMVQTYLSAVQSMVDADGATLFFPSSDEETPWKPMVRCETDLALTLLPHWEQHEKLLLSQFDQDSDLQSYDSETLRELGIETLMRAAMLIPLWQQQHISGVFCFTRRNGEPFNSSERQLAYWAAQHLGKTLVRLQSIANIKRQARQDGLTQLANRRSFDEQIQREVRAAQRAGAECSLLFCDLDGFKAVNDTYGHPAGDEVLRCVARILHQKAVQSPAGEQAVTARYGGEELAILLPGQGAEAAVEVGENIRQAVGQETYWWQQIPMNITISVGVATFPVHAVTAEALIVVADEALLLAKASGKNQVCCATSTAPSSA